MWNFRDTGVSKNQFWSKTIKLKLGFSNWCPIMFDLGLYLLNLVKKFCDSGFCV